MDGVERSRRELGVALLDVDMPVLDGPATAKGMAGLYPSVAVMMLTATEHEESLAKSLALNVRGFLTKDIPSAQLVQLIKQAHAGCTVFGPRPTSILADSYLNSGRNDPRIRRLPRPSGASPEPPARHVRPAHPGAAEQDHRQTARPERGHRALLHIRDLRRTRIHQPRRTHHHRHQGRILNHPCKRPRPTQKRVNPIADPPLRHDDGIWDNPQGAFA